MSKNNYKTTRAAFLHWRITIVILSMFTVLTKHHSLHGPEHIGMFAGSLLQRGDWDHSTVSRHE